MSSGSTFAFDAVQGTPLSYSSTKGKEAWSNTSGREATSKMDYNQNLKSDLPEPPFVPLNCVPLSEIASRVLAAATSQILGIIEAIRGQSPAERRNTIIEYILSKREYFAKLLVLARFSRYTREQKKIAGVHVLLDEHNSSLSENADSPVRSCSYLLFSAIERLYSLRFTSSYDLDSASEILFTGKVRSLPENLRSLFPYIETQKFDTDVVQLSLESVLHTRLSLEIITKDMEGNITIEDGQLIVHIPGVYKAKVTLFGRSFQSPWKVLDVHLFVKFPNTDDSGLYKSKINERTDEVMINLQAIFNSLCDPDNVQDCPFPIGHCDESDVQKEIQHKNLFSIKNPIISELMSKSFNTEKHDRSLFIGEKVPKKDDSHLEGCDLYTKEKTATRQVVPVPYSLYCMHYYLSHIHHGLRLEILKAQALYLNETRWHNFLRINTVALENSMEIKYWFREMKIPESGHECAIYYNLLKIEPIYTYPQLPSIFKEWCENRLFDEVFEKKFPHLYEVVVGMRKQDLTKLMAQKVLGYDDLPNQDLKTSVCACVQNKGTASCKIEPHPLIGSTKLAYKVNDIDIEKLIVSSAASEIRAFYRNLKAASLMCGMTCNVLEANLRSFKLGCPSKDSMDVDDDQQYPISARLRWLKNTQVDVLVNMYTGKVGIGVPDLNASVGKEYSLLGERLNMSMWGNISSIKDALIEFQNKVISEKIEKMAYLANMRVFKSSPPFRSQETKKILDNLPPVSLFLMSAFHDDTWLLICAAHKNFWTSKSQTQDLEACNSDSIEKKSNDGDILYRVWFIRSKQRNDFNGTFREINYFTPVSVADLANYKRFNSGGGFNNFSPNSDNFYWRRLSLSQLCRLDIIGRYVTLYSDILGEIKYFRIPALYTTESNGNLMKKVVDENTSAGMLAMLDSRIMIPSSLYLFSRSRLGSGLSVEQLPGISRISDIFVYVLPGSVPAKSAGPGVIPNTKSITGKKSIAPGAVLVFQMRIFKDIKVYDFNIELTPSKRISYDSNTRILSIFLSKNDEETSYLDIVMSSIHRVMLMINIALDYNKHALQYPLLNLEQEYFNLFRLVYLYKSVRIVVSLSDETSSYLSKDSAAQQVKLNFPLYQVKLEFLHKSSAIKDMGLELAVEDVLSTLSRLFSDILNITKSVLYSLSAIKFVLDTAVLIIQNLGNALEWLDPLMGLSIQSVNNLVLRPSAKHPNLYLYKVKGMNLVVANYRYPSVDNATQKEGYDHRKHSKETDPKSKDLNHRIGVSKILGDMFKNMYPEKNNVVFPCAQGIVFNVSMLNCFISVLIRYFGTIEVFSWLTGEIKNFKTLNVLKESDMDILVEFETRVLSISVNDLCSWEIRFSSKYPTYSPSQGNTISDTELDTVNKGISEKTNSCEAYQLKSLLTFIIELLISPDILFTDICRVLLFEKTNTGTESLFVKLLICPPMGYKSQLSRSTINTAEQLVTIMFQISLSNPDESIILPVKYNYSTGVIGRWHDVANNAEDLTTVEKMDSMMMQKFQLDSSSGDVVSSLFAKVSVSAPNDSEGGPGKLYPFVKSLCQTCSNVSQLMT